MSEAITDVVTQAGIDAYAELSGDFNPLHVDPEAAAASEFGGIIAHGPIALHAFFRAATAWAGADALAARLGGQGHLPCAHAPRRRDHVRAGRRPARRLRSRRRRGGVREPGRHDGRERPRHADARRLAGERPVHVHALAQDGELGARRRGRARRVVRDREVPAGRLAHDCGLDPVVQ